MLRTLLALTTVAAVTAQGQSYQTNVDFAGNQVSLTSWNGAPAFLIYNLAPLTVQSGTTRRLVDFLRPTNGMIPVRIFVHDLVFFESEACAWGHDVILSRTQQGDWRGSVGAQGFAVHPNVGRALEWSEPGAGTNVVPAGVLDYDVSGGPLVGCDPGRTPLAPAFCAVCSWEVVPSGTVAQFSGFETGDLGEFGVQRGAVAVQTATARSGHYALQASGMDYAYVTVFREDDRGLSTAPLDLLDTYASFYFRYAVAAGRHRIAEVGSMGGARKAVLELEPDGRLTVEDYAWTRFTGLTVLQPDRWYRIRWHVGTGLSAPTEVLVDNSLDINAAANLTQDAARVLNLGLLTRNGGWGEVYFDDLVLSRQGFAGDGTIELLRPIGPGSYTAWNGTFADVDDWPHDGDASMCVSAAGGTTAVTFALDLSRVTGEVLAVKPQAVLRRADQWLVTNSALRLRSGSVDADTTAGDGGPEYRLRSMLLNRDPATGAPWTLAGLGGIEVGAVSFSDRVTRMTAAGASVLFIAPPVN